MDIKIKKKIVRSSSSKKKIVRTKKKLYGIRTQEGSINCRDGTSSLKVIAITTNQEIKIKSLKVRNRKITIIKGAITQKKTE